MSNPTYFYLPFLMLLIVVHLLFINQNTATATVNNDMVPFIRKSCAVTEYPDTCVSVLEGDPRSRIATDLKNLTKISMDIVYEEAIGLKSLFIKAGENVTDPVLKMNIGSCIGEFETCSFHMKTYGIPSFENGDYADAISQVTYCIDCSSNCTDTGTKLFNEEIETLFNLSTDVLGLSSMVPSRTNM
ncbi:hypothetical protein Dsin_021818 [Dipteronia sinensis]|uniref:Pectinesterase inhibitor domain-containing protein n=1 Tax=Dipteronia sinensis TaxID=43782 RepID=A0AAE0A094_9ROSI|nr:hypothetical protein Dsin_021818 [Dipteronia sinensis]